MDEIDAIFASKGKAKATDHKPSASEAASAPSLKKKNKNKNKKNNKVAQPSPVEDKPPPPSKKRPAPETIVDPSLKIAEKRTKVAPSLVRVSKSKQREEEQEDFRDSRGTGPRRKTEEGWNVYKEAELGIGVEAGDTPLCPFDCDCCF